MPNKIRRTLNGENEKNVCNSGKTAEILGVSTGYAYKIIWGLAEQWERDFLQQQQCNLDINFENFVQIYYEDIEHRLRENTMRTKKFIIDLKIIPYFKNKKMNEIKALDVRAWQNALMKKGYSQTNLKTVNNQLSAIFNYAVKYYDLRDNPCRKDGSIGKSHAGERQFWTKQEFK